MSERIPVLIDSDANNEVDDQHAIAYALFSDDVLDVVGLTVNNTPHGNGIQGQYDEAQRVLRLCDAEQIVPLYKGAEEGLEEILPHIRTTSFDGRDAVDFIIEAAMVERTQKLVLLPIGKLTNIALALAREPQIKSRIKVVWLGSNYPESGEYNLAADPDSVNFVLRSGVEFEIVTVRYQEPTGSAAVQTTREEIQQKMPGKGPRVAAVTGRNGGEFTRFGDYSVNLFENFRFSPWSLFDVVAIAVVKDPTFGEIKEDTVPPLEETEWDHDSSTRYTVRLWENFDKEAILKDFFETMEHADQVD